MFGFFSSVEKQMRANAANWLELADKVYHYRRDELSEAERTNLQQSTETLRGQVRERADASKLKLSIENLETVLRRTGGKIYPKSTVQEYVEFFLVAAIVILGIRTYFVQPFKIPTNSMWPSYNGMTAEVYKNPADTPNPVNRAVRLALFGAFHKQVEAPVSGPIRLPVRPDGRLVYDAKPGRSWLIFSTTVREYVFVVGDEMVRLQVPIDFDLDSALPGGTSVIQEALGYNLSDLAERAQNSPNKKPGFAWVTLDREVQRGQTFLSFDILSGDQLFVDRFSYHFMRPKVGQGFVFRTGNLEELPRYLPPGTPTDQYYIKRLVGVPGDKLKIEAPVLYRNGAPITGAASFDKEAHRKDKYPGYVNVGRLAVGSTVEVPKDGFFPMGDNSPNSLDGRYWGFVPKKDAIGRPLFIYYPFTHRWGPAP